MNWCEDCQVNGQACRSHGTTVAIPVLDRCIRRASYVGDTEAVAWLGWLADTYEQEQTDDD